MALWLWVTDLDAKNDWLKLTSLSWGSHYGTSTPGGGRSSRTSGDRELSLTLDPGRFHHGLMKWFIRGDQRTAYVFIDPQTEYECSDAMPTGMTSYSGNSVSLTISFMKMQVKYSGAP